MALSLADLRSVRNDAPLRALIYGDQGMGKTTLASEFPNPVVLQVEEGTPAGVELVSFGYLETYAQFIEALMSLHGEEHDFQTCVVDSFSALQKLLFEETCARGDEKGNAKSRIEDFGYGKGYVYARNVLSEVLGWLRALRRDRGMNILFTAHAAITKFDDPESVSYDRYDLDVNKHLYGDLTRDLDAILLLKKSVQIKEEKVGPNSTRAIGAGSASSPVMICTVGKPSMVAKNRYDMPAEIRFERGKGYAELAKYLPNG